MKKKTEMVLLFDRTKYTWLIAGLAVTAVGFLLMIGGKGAQPDSFSEDIFSFRRMTLAPILVLAGYVMQIYAILKKSTNNAESTEQMKAPDTPKRTAGKQKRR